MHRLARNVAKQVGAGQGRDQADQAGEPRVCRVRRAASRRNWSGPWCDSGEGAEDTEVLNVLTMGVAPYTDPKYSERFRANAFFIGNSVRDAVGQVRADYTPIFFSQIPDLFKSGRVPIDVALIMVSPPDEHGFCSLGVSVDMTERPPCRPRLLVAQVNSHMPRTLGNSFIHVRDIDYLVEHDEPLLEWPVIDEPDEDDAADRRQRRQPGRRRRHAADGHRPAAGYRPAVADRSQRSGDPHRDVLRRRDATGPSRA